MESTLSLLAMALLQDVAPAPRPWTDPLAWWQSVQGDVVSFGLSLLAALAILFLGMWAARLIANGARASLLRAKVDETLASFLANLARMGLIALVVISALGRIGVETTSFVAVLGALGLAVGFALQSSLGNFASGVMIMLFRPFRLGDYVDAGGTAGTVEQILVFQTVLKTPDNRRVIVPNAQIAAGVITNYSAMPTRRVDLVFGIGYEDDLGRTREVLEGLLAADPRILEDPAPLVAVGELADSSVNFIVRPWVKSADYWDVYWDLTEAVKRAFDQQGISIPFPQRDVHLHQVA